MDLDEVAHYEPPLRDLLCLQIQLFSSLVLKELRVNSVPFTVPFIHQTAVLRIGFLAHLSHRLMVSYCHQPMSGVRRQSSVVRRQQLLQTSSPLKPLSLGP